ncbi:cation efflux protein [Pseudohyphozyma bogoriensis]|nr:cation efflux protein [Pseudohyphozyma bogoriensis]
MPSWPTSSLFYKIVVFVTMIYMLIELVIGYQYNSLVLISDSFSDVFTWVIALYGDAISESEQVDHLGNVKESDSFSFGFGRSKMLANLINGVSLFALSLTLGLEAIQSHSHDNDSQSDPAGNLSDDSQLDYPDEPSQGGHNHHGGKFAAALLHVLSDMLINFSVILSGGLSYGFGPQSPSGTSMFFASGINANYRTPYVSYVDPLLSLIIVVMLIKPTLKLINSQTYGLLQAIHPADTRRLRNRLFRTLPQIAADEHGQPMITELHLWELQHDVKVGSVKIGVHVNNFNELEWLRKAAENAFIQFGVRKEFANIELYDPTWDPTKAHYLKLGERKVNHVEGPRPGTPPAHEHHSALGRVKKAAKKVTGKGRKKGSRSGDVPVSSGEDSS